MLVVVATVSFLIDCQIEHQRHQRLNNKHNDASFAKYYCLVEAALLKDFAMQAKSFPFQNRSTKRFHWNGLIRLEPTKVWSDL
jgi:hypothetical protein